MARTTGRRRRRLVAASALPLAAAGVVAPSAASAGNSQPGPITDMHVVRVSANSLTVGVTGLAQRYRLFVAPHKRNLELSVISKARSISSRSPEITMSGLQYSTTPYFYRVEALNGASHHRFTKVGGTVGLQPATPSGPAATAHPGEAISLHWHSGPATGFAVTQSTSPDMSTDRVSYTRIGRERQFTPYHLKPGTTYYFTVSALNDFTPSLPSPVVSATAAVGEQPVRVMTYNLLKALLDGTTERGNRIAPWSKRVGPAVSRIHQAHPDVIAVQEGTSWVNPGKTERQVQSLAHHLGGQYAIGPTAIPPAAPNFGRTGVFVLYDRAKYRPVGEGGWWNDGNFRWTAYQELADRVSGARFVVVSVHLLPNLGASGDVKREMETRTLVAQGSKLSASRGVPVIYAGDFNSDPTSTYTYDAPGKVMAGADINDSFDLAASHVNARFNSFNKYLRHAPATGAQIDRIFAAPGVAVIRWGMVMRLSHGSVVGPMPSDHNPVYADLLVPTPAG